MEDSKIEWTDNTFNPWWGCQRVSPGCEHCYAETFSKRVGRDLWGPKAGRRIASESYWRKPLKWNADAIKADTWPFVFCASMCDVFEDRPDLVEPRNRLWRLIESTPRLTWQLLTKRPENFSRMRPSWWDGWPDNVWLMTTAEDQNRLDERARFLCKEDCVVRGISAEPLLGPLDISEWAMRIDWVIVGGESGQGARPFDMDWARRIANECDEYGVSFFMKQTGSVYAKVNGIAGKGDKLEDLPEDLRVREFPGSERP